MNSTKKTVAFLSSSALAAGAAHGAILYTPVNITISSFEALDLDLNLDGLPDYQIQWSAGNVVKPYIFQGPSGSANASSFVLANSSQGLPVTGIGTLINASYQTAQTAGYFNQNGSATVVGGWTATGTIEGYVGLEINNGSSVNYGWAHFIYNSAGTPANDVDHGVLTLVDAAMETTPGAGILTGQTAETGTAPVAEVLPLSQANYIGGTVQLSVVASGNPAPSFRWQAGAVGSGVYTNINLSGRVTDATVNTDGAANTLTIHNLALSDTADYVVVVSNANGSITTPPATLSVLSASDGPATLVHRYSFQDPAGSSTFADSVGGPDWAGALAGDATLTGSSLSLDGTGGTYGYLPSGITSDYTQMTVEFWADIGASNPPWTRVFSFGDQSSGGSKSSGVDFSPYAPGPDQNLDFLNSSGDDAYANYAVTLAGTVNSHITVVVDSVNDSLYFYNGTNVVSTFHDNNLALNQTLVASSAGVPGMSLSAIDDVYNVIGASLVEIDPYLIGTIHEFRIYQGVLSPQAVALNDAIGPVNYIELSANPTLTASLSGGNIVLSWPASDFNFAVQSRSGLSSGTPWTTLPNAPVLVGDNWQVSIPSTGTAQFFQLTHK